MDTDEELEKQIFSSDQAHVDVDDVNVDDLSEDCIEELLANTEEKEKSEEIAINGSCKEIQVLKEDEVVTLNDNDDTGKEDALDNIDPLRHTKKSAAEEIDLTGDELASSSEVEVVRYSMTVDEVFKEEVIEAQSENKPENCQEISKVEVIDLIPDESTLISNEVKLERINYDDGEVEKKEDYFSDSSVEEIIPEVETKILESSKDEDKWEDCVDISDNEDPAEEQIKPKTEGIEKEDVVFNGQEFVEDKPSGFKEEIVVEDTDLVEKCVQVLHEHAPSNEDKNSSTFEDTKIPKEENVSMIQKDDEGKIPVEDLKCIEANHGDATSKEDKNSKAFETTEESKRDDIVSEIPIDVDEEKVAPEENNADPIEVTHVPTNEDINSSTCEATEDSKREDNESEIQEVAVEDTDADQKSFKAIHKHATIKEEKHLSTFHATKDSKKEDNVSEIQMDVDEEKVSPEENNTEPIDVIHAPTKEDVTLPTCEATEDLKREDNESEIQEVDEEEINVQDADADQKCIEVIHGHATTKEYKNSSAFDATEDSKKEDNVLEIQMDVDEEKVCHEENNTDPIEVTRVLTNEDITSSTCEATEDSKREVNESEIHEVDEEEINAQDADADQKCTEVIHGGATTKEDKNSSAFDATEDSEKEDNVSEIQMDVDEEKVALQESNADPIEVTHAPTNEDITSSTCEATKESMKEDNMDCMKEIQNDAVVENIKDGECLEGWNTPGKVDKTLAEAEEGIEREFINGTQNDVSGKCIQDENSHEGKHSPTTDVTEKEENQSESKDIVDQENMGEVPLAAEVLEETEKKEYRSELQDKENTFAAKVSEESKKEDWSELHDKFAEENTRKDQSSLEATERNKEIEDKSEIQDCNMDVEENAKTDKEKCPEEINDHAIEQEGAVTIAVDAKKKVEDELDLNSPQKKDTISEAELSDVKEDMPKIQDASDKIDSDEKCHEEGGIEIVKEALVAELKDLNSDNADDNGSDSYHEAADGEKFLANPIFENNDDLEVDENNDKMEVDESIDNIGEGVEIEREVVSCLKDVLDKINHWSDGSDNSSTTDDVCKIIETQTISGSDFMEASGKETAKLKEDDSIRGEGSDSSSPLLGIIKPKYVYSREQDETDSVDINIPEISEDEDGAEPLTPQDTSSPLEERSLPQPALSSSEEDFVGFEKHEQEATVIKTDSLLRNRNKFLKVQNGTEVHYFKAERSSPENKLHLKYQMSRCTGCQFKMPNIRYPHKCVDNFCVFCQQSVGTTYEVHTLENHLKDMKSCPFCAQQVASVQQLETHLSTHTDLKIRPSVCVGCKKAFKTLEGRVSHKCSYESICKYCNIMYPTPEKLSDHLETQHKRETLQKSILKEHKIFMCTVCDKRFLSLNKLDLHLSRHFSFEENSETMSASDEDEVDAENKVSDENESASRLYINVEESQKILKCPHCTHSSDCRSKLNEHLHISNFCMHCLTQLGSTQEFEIHMVECHSSEKRCQFCEEDFNAAEELVKHCKVHTSLNITPFICPLCCLCFSLRENLESHNCSGSSPPAKIFCAPCKICFSSNLAHEFHMLYQHSETYNCPTCKSENESYTQLFGHLKKDHSESLILSFLCGKCRQLFETEDDYHIHRCVVDGASMLEITESESSDQLLACLICGMEFNCEEELDVHFNTLVGEAIKIAKEKFCSFCKVEFATRSSFESHMIRHHLSIHQCPFCLKFFSSKNAMERHLLHHTNIHRHELYCGTCRRILFSRGLFESHVCQEDEIETDTDNSNQGEDKLQKIFCPTCNEGFKSEKILNNHIPIHEVKSFPCTICQRQLKSAATLEEHLNLHKNATTASPKMELELSPRLRVPKLQLADESNKCRPCKRIFRTTEEFDRHNETIHCYSVKLRDKVDSCSFLRCRFCDMKLESYFWVAHHYTTSHDIIASLNHQCKMCDVRFHKASEKINHFCPKTSADEVKQEAPSQDLQPNMSATEIKEELEDPEETLKQKKQVVIHSVVKRGRPMKKLEVDLNKLEHPCSHCKDVFVNQKSLMDHCIKVLFCVKCLKSFQDKDKFEQHMMYLHCTSSTCMFCSEKMASTVLLIKHLKLHSKLKYRPKESIKGKIFGCRCCNNAFKKPNLYEKHVIENHGNRKLCPFCGKFISLRTKMLEHYSTHTTLNAVKIFNASEKRKAAEHAKKQEEAEEKKNAVKLAEEKKIAEKLAEEKKIAAKLAEEKKNAAKLAEEKKIAAKLAEEKKSAAQNKKLASVEKRSPAQAKKPSPVKLTPEKKSTAVGSKASSVKSAEKKDVENLKGRRTRSKGVESEEAPESESAPLPLKPSLMVKGDMCMVCKKKIRSQSLLYHHVMDNHFKGSLQCPFCDKKFNALFKTKMHIWKLHLIKMTQEPELSEEAPADKEITEAPQPATNQSDEIFTCSICAKIYSSQHFVDKHIRLFHNIDPAKAQLLERTVGAFPSNCDESKLTSVGPDQNTFCFHCHTSFNTPMELRAHGMKAGVFCEFCRRTLPDSGEYEMHMLEEHPMEDTCQFCGAYIPNKPALEIHIRKHTKIGPIHYKCFGCNQIFTSSKAKDEHPCVAFACPKCNMPQKGPDGLENHLATAHNEAEKAAQEPPRPMSVEVPISTATAKKRGRKRRVDARLPSNDDSEGSPNKQKRSDEDSSSHNSSTVRSEGKKISSTVECPHCDRRFQNEHGLLVHCSSAKIYCRTCKKIFPSSTDLANHVKTHDEAGPTTSNQSETDVGYFGCRFCGEKFENYSSLNNHQRIHVIYQCSNCLKVCDSESLLNSHRRQCFPSLGTVIKQESDSDSDIMVIEDTPKKASGGQFVLL
ncbi:uncharacterized protein LOC132197726 isoform X2 [Neocloeon triangulifer]|uniref:uncharacterized protein LOC132197726 isoform X2 n=1 Tax=Neocloeon triangulifer TaxID=2078957 RepID=UPI00286F9D9C|nr:uncharacterized protein LOC132197726 isoform X2 [Neocloeon triangulifer]